MQRPQPGSEIQVQVEYSMNANMIPPRPTKQTYRGRVLASHRWLTDREFCLSGDDAWPVRVINLQHVTDIQYLSGQGVDVRVSARTWEVVGSRGDRYLVSRDSRGWSCACAGFQFRKNCRHVTQISAQNL